MRWGKVDYRDFERAQKQLEQLAKVDFQRLTESLAKEIAARVLNKATKRTPTGEKPVFKDAEGKKLPKSKTVVGKSGKKRSFLTKEGAILDQYWSDYEGGTLKRGWKVGEIVRKGDLYEIEVYNPVEYSTYVEYGHRQQPGRYVPALGKRLKSSWVEGKFMLTISVQEVETQSRALIERRVMEELKKVFE